MTDKVCERRKKRYLEQYKPAYDAFIRFYPFTLENLDGEQWADIPNLEGYQVSTFGRVKSFARYPQGKILKPVLSGNGYLYLNLTRHKRIFVHVLVAQTFIPNPNVLPQVDHRYGMKFDNSVVNLEWVTKAENERRSWELGLRKSGELHQNAKLTDADILYIRENPNNFTGEQLSTQFGVSKGHISQIQTGLNRKSSGGQIRKSKTPPSLPNSAKEMIRAEYQKSVRGHGAPALAKKYGVCSATIQKIINEK